MTEETRLRFKSKAQIPIRKPEQLLLIMVFGYFAIYEKMRTQTMGGMLLSVYW